MSATAKIQPPKILITDDVHSLLIDGLTADGYLVDYRPEISAEEVPGIIADYEGLIINSKVYAGKEIFEKAANLRFVCRAGSGLEVIDLVEAKKRNITAFNSPEGNRNAVAEHSLGMLLNSMNHISKSFEEVKRYKWLREENRGNELSGKTVALIAYGHTAQAFAKVLRGFDVNILAYDKYVTGFSDDYVIECSLTEIFQQADVLSLHLPLTAETTNSINYSFLSSFAKPYWLINTSRGKVLQTSAMLQCFNENRIYGAALDVLENEKLSDMSDKEKSVFEALVTDKRILLTPHIAGWTYESKQKIAETLLRKIREVA